VEASSWALSTSFFYSSVGLRHRGVHSSLLVNLGEEGVMKGVLCRDAFRVVQFKHLIKQVKGQRVVYLANFRPLDLFFLHFLGNEAPVTVLKGDFFDCVRAEEAHEGDQVGNCEVFDLRAIVQTEDWVALCEEGEEDDAASPHIDGACLVWVRKQGFWGHVPLGASPILNLHLLLKLDNLFDELVITVFFGLGSRAVHLDFRKTEVD